MPAHLGVTWRALGAADRLPWRALRARGVRRRSTPGISRRVDSGPWELLGADQLLPEGRARGKVRRPGGSGEEPGLPPRPDAHSLLHEPRGALPAPQHSPPEHRTPLSRDITGVVYKEGSVCTLSS